MRNVTVFLAIIFGYVPAILGTTCLVCPDGSGDFLTIQAAVESANDGDVILLCDATFSGPGNRDIDFLGKAITIQSASENAHSCVIDLDSAARGFIFSNDEGAGSILRQITIRDAGGGDYGGGIRCVFSSPRVEGCILDRCRADIGGAGIYIAGGSPVIVDCRIQDAYIASGQGAAIYVDNGTARLDGCFILESEASPGACVYLFGSSVSMMDCTLADNVSTTSAVYCQENSEITLTNTIISFTESGQAIDCNSNCNVSLTCCDLYGNEGGDWIGMIAGQLGVNGNIQMDPLFCRDNCDEEPFALIWYSPCAPDYNPACGLIGAGPVGCDAPTIRLLDGHLFQDGFGQHNPFNNDAEDVGCANIALNLRSNVPDYNDYLGDSAVVCGPEVSTADDSWLVDLCFRVARKGPQQDMIPAYASWKSRLSSDPELGFVAVLMDSVERSGQAEPDSFATYFHEEDPGFDFGHPDYSTMQEILPDEVFVPGTRIEYYYRGYYQSAGGPPAAYHVLPTEEFEILPSMRVDSANIVWPEVLYIDAHDQASSRDETEVEEQIEAFFERSGIPYDRYDYLGASEAWNATMRRSYGQEGHTPHRHGNNGCTVGQLLGYRFILLNTGDSGPGTLEEEDLVLLKEWLDFKCSDLLEIRRGIIFNGDQIGTILDSLDQLGVGRGPSRDELQLPMQEVLGFALLRQDATPYGEPEHCIFIETDDEPDRYSCFSPLEPGIGLYGASWDPDHNEFAQLGVDSTVSGVVGNLLYHYYSAGGLEDSIVAFAQIVRDAVIPDSSNWRSVVDGFSLHHLSEWECGELCSSDSVCVARGIDNLMLPELDWILAGSASTCPGLWSFWCPACEADDGGKSHVSNHLFACCPNPMLGAASIQFQLSSPGKVSINIFDASGRLVRNLLNKALPTGNHACVWHQDDQTGHAVASGMYWVQMKVIPNGNMAKFESTQRVLALR